MVSWRIAGFTESFATKNAVPSATIDQPPDLVPVNGRISSREPTKKSLRRPPLFVSPSHARLARMARSESEAMRASFGSAPDPLST